MDRARKVALLRQALKQPGKKLGDDEYAFFCPKHGARPDRVVGQLGINVSTDKFHCYSCGFSGRNLLFLFPKGSPEWEEYKGSISDGKLEKLEKKFATPKIPEEFRSLSREWRSPFYRAAVSYLEGRGFNMDDIITWKLGYAEDGQFKNRIIIPSFDEFGNINFLTGRAFYENMPRYSNGNYNKDIIFNDYMIDWKKPVILTEGPFDAMKAGQNAIPLQGSDLGPGTKLFSKIVLSGTELYIALDSEAFSNSLKMIENFTSYGVSCRYVSIAGFKDVGVMTREQFTKAKEKATKINSDLDILRLKVSA